MDCNCVFPIELVPNGKKSLIELRWGKRLDSPKCTVLLAWDEKRLMWRGLMSTTVLEEHHRSDVQLSERLASLVITCAHMRTPHETPRITTALSYCGVYGGPLNGPSLCWEVPVSRTAEILLHFFFPVWTWINRSITKIYIRTFI